VVDTSYVARDIMGRKLKAEGSRRRVKRGRLKGQRWKGKGCWIEVWGFPNASIID
jgi:hypothetical protein